MKSRTTMAATLATMVGAGSLAVASLPSQAATADPAAPGQSAAVLTDGASQSDDARLRKRTFVKTRMPKVKGKIYFRTKVRNYRNRKTAFWQKKSAKGRWHVIARKRTNSNGIVRYRAWAPRRSGVRWYYKVSTPRTKRFALSFSRSGYTYRY